MGHCFNTKTEKLEIVSDKDVLKFATQDQLVAKHATTYLVTCMDFRLIDDVCRAMDSMGYNNNYDQFIVAGASLGFCQNKYPHWRQTVFDHFEIGLNLHKFREFIFIDHLDCGAYKKFYPEIENFEDEERYHKIHLQQTHDLLQVKFPDFKFQAFLMDLSGEFVEIEIDRTVKSLKVIDNASGDKFLSSIDDNPDQMKQSFRLGRKQSTFAIEKRRSNYF